MDDQIIKPAAWQLLACLDEAVQRLLPEELRPKAVGLRPGQSIALLIAQYGNECCSGLAWVRAGGATPIPADIDSQRGCGISAFRIPFEIGIARCAPLSDGTNLITSDVWDGKTELTYDDFSVMLCAYRCMVTNWKDQGSVLLGGWTPLAVQGQCMGGTLQVTVESPYCLDCSGGESPS